LPLISGLKHKARQSVPFRDLICAPECFGAAIPICCTGHTAVNPDGTVLSGTILSVFETYFSSQFQLIDAPVDEI
jgi:hypothetical protein